MQFENRAITPAIRFPFGENDENTSVPLSVPFARFQNQATDKLSLAIYSSILPHPAGVLKVSLSASITVTINISNSLTVDGNNTPIEVP